MKKIVTAHLGSKVFQIEEDAYAYLNRFLSRHRDNQSLEIQVANILSEKLISGKQAITYPDVVDTLYQLGYSASEMQQEQREQSSKEKKLYRNINDKKIAGVCSGIADYFDADPTLIRALFIIAFITCGFGFLAYIALWIIMPKQGV